MTDERYAEADKTGQLTEEEVNQGWHFCLELDGALVNHVGCENTEWCKCLDQLHAKRSVVDDAGKKPRILQTVEPISIDELWEEFEFHGASKNE